ncbi:MAG: ATP-binding protein [Candidatus Eiseniibacteriota bacterium]
MAKSESRSPKASQRSPKPSVVARDTGAHAHGASAPDTGVRPTSIGEPNDPSAERVLALTSLLFDAVDTAQVLRRLVALLAVPGGAGLQRAFLLVVDAERHVLAGRHAFGPADAGEAARMGGFGSTEGMRAGIAAVGEDELESAAPLLTAQVRALSFPLAPGLDAVVDALLDAHPRAFTEAEPRLSAAWRERLGLESFVAAPVIASGRPVALLVADRAFSQTPATEADVPLVAAWAALAGAAYERVALAVERAERGSQLATLEETVRSALTATSLRTELALLVRAAAQTLSCRGGVLWRSVGARASLVLESVHVSDDRSDPLRQAEALEPLARATLRERSARTIPDAAADPHLDPAAVRGFGAVYVTPVGAGGPPVGILALWGPAPRRLSDSGAFERDDARLVETIAATAALVIGQSALSERVRKAEELLRESQRQLSASERLATLGEMGARAAQEARQPLASIGGFARRVHRALGPDDPNREYVEIILRESDRLERLLSEQLAFAALARPRLALESVNQILAGTLTALSDVLVKKRIRLLKKLAPDVPSLLLDAEKIRQVVRNMLEHSIDALGPNGRLRVESRRAHGYVVVEIASDGPPLAGDLLDQLFVPFSASRRSGEVVGLALAQQVVQSHGGEIRVRSEGDWGVIFSFTLPVVENQDRRRSQDRRGVRRDRRNRFPAA